MHGRIGQLLRLKEDRIPTARKALEGVFQPQFETIAGWRNMLDNIPGWDVNLLLNRVPGFWQRNGFHALYVACWIFHPMEKGTFMLQLSPGHYANLRAAYDRMLQSGELQSRISSHLSKRGASAHQGWNFLCGYEELLLQIEGETNAAPYLMLKCEGHALKPGFSLSTIMHGAAWVKKSMTGSGVTDSPTLHNLAKLSTAVELRAAENYSKGYEKVINKLGLSGTMVTVEDVLSNLLKKANFNGRLPDNIKRNTHELGRAMLGPGGYIALLKRQSTVLKRNGINFDDKLQKEFTNLAERMIATSVAHPRQFYNEIQVSPNELNQALQAFRGFIG